MTKNNITVLITAAAASLLVAGCAGGQEQTAVSAVQTQQETQQTNAQAQTESDQETQETAAQTQTAVEDEAADGSYMGIIVDATMNEITVDTAEGKLYNFPIPENRDMLKLDSIMLGDAVTVTVKNAGVTLIESSQKEPKADSEVLMFAGDLLFTFKYKDMERLADMAEYPVYVDADGSGKGVTVKNREEFLKLDADAVFSADRINAVLGTNLFELEELDGGTYIMGNPDGKPNVIFQQTDKNDTGFAVTGIN